MAEKLKKNRKIKKAIEVIRDGVSKRPSVALYTYLGKLYFDDGNLLLAALSFAKALEIYEGPQPPSELFSFLKNEVVRANADPIYFTYQLAMRPEVGNQLRYKLYLKIIREMFVGVKSAITQQDLFSLHKQILSNIPYVPWNKLTAIKNKDVMILCTQILGVRHGPTSVVLTMAKNVREMGWNPIVICINSWDVDDKYNKDFVLNKNMSFKRHADFDLDNNTISERPEYPFSTIKFKDEKYPFFFLDMSFGDKCEQFQYIFEDAINNENIIIGYTGQDIFLDVLGRYTKVYTVPTSSSLPITKTTFPAVLKREFTEEEAKLLEGDEYFQNGYVYISSPRLIEFESERIEDKSLPINLEFAIVGRRLEQEMDDDFYKRMASIYRHNDSASFRFIGGIINQDALLTRMGKDGISKDSIIFEGESSDLKLSLSHATFYLNPKRTGGGLSSVEALSLNIPVITYPVGDVYNYCGECSAFIDDQSVLDFIRNYLNDPQFRRETSECLKNKFDLIPDFKQLIRDITRGQIS